MESLTLHNLKCGYHRQTILKTESVTFVQGSFCALLGLNGSGKSTLLQTISGVLPAISGHCTLGEQNLTKIKIRQRAQRISYLPQQSSRLEAVTVLDVLLMGLNPWLGIMQSPDKIQKAKVMDICIRMGLGSFAEKDFSKLSGGQKQRVLLARAVVQNTPVMLMDEPDSALDYGNRHEMMQGLSKLIHSEQKIGIIATHDPNFALAYCDRILILKDGGVSKDFSPKDTPVGKIEKALADIYGSIQVIEIDGSCFMLPDTGHSIENYKI